MRRILALVLTMMLLCSAGANALAEARASDYFSTYGISLSTVGSGKIDITFSCSSVGTASQLGVSTYNVYQYDDDGSWDHVAGPLNGSTASNTSSHSFAKRFSGVAGEKYRVTCTFMCTKSDGSAETKGYTSRSITAN